MGISARSLYRTTAPGYREYAYVTNSKSNTVSVIDIRTFALAKAPSRSAWSQPASRPTARKNEIYVVNTGSSNVSVINAETNVVVAVIGVHGKPYFIDVSEDGKRAYVANLKGSANVSVIDLEKRAVVGTLHRGRVCQDWRGFRRTARRRSLVSTIAATTAFPSSMPGSCACAPLCRRLPATGRHRHPA